MALRFHDTRTRQVETFAPANPPKVTVYACGPTVYDHVHIGNLSAYLFYDVLRRWLARRGYAVRFVSNITDVDDKTIRDSRKAGVPLGEFTERYTKAYFDDLAAVGVLPADAYPRATEHVDGMRAMIQVLLDKGHAYLAEDGSVYFRVASFPTYGELANLTRESLKAGASGRVRADEYEKEEVADFALWKAYDEADGDVFWEPTFTVGGVARKVKGRPGWHIECSVMASALLGDQIDVHMGGEDLKFPHHQNEIAQSEAATGKRPFVRTWLHRRHLLVDGAKMSKRLKNFFTLKDLVARVGPSAPRAFRYLVVTAHYRTPIDFTWASLDAAATTLRNLSEARARFHRLAAGAAPSEGGPAAEALTAFSGAMDDDLDASRAMAAVHGLVGEWNRREQAGTLAPADAAAGVALLDAADAALGLFLTATRALTAEERGLLEARAAARAARDWAESDRLRDELARRGVLVKDGKDGQTHSFS
jgi:cysteinyl-tRNA synthetase